MTTFTVAGTLAIHRTVGGRTFKDVIHQINQHVKTLLCKETIEDDLGCMRI